MSREVSILVVLDVVLEGVVQARRTTRDTVSILVVLDVVLEVPQNLHLYSIMSCFNPCCAGCSSGSKLPLLYFAYVPTVSILVVLDVVLEGSPSETICFPYL